MPPLSEAETEAQITDILLRHNWYGVKTDAALVETKTVTGKLSDAQVEKHAELRDLYGIRTHVLRGPSQALALVTEARRILGALQAGLA